jgi:hypothetical protein
MKNEGLGFVYQPTYRDRKTGELRTSRGRGGFHTRIAARKSGLYTGGRMHSEPLTPEKAP